MLKYPDDFNTPAFPAGKPVAISRFMGIALAVVFILIMCSAGLVVWASKSRSIHPFLIYINRLTGQWIVVSHQHGQKSVTRARALQESLIYDFTNNWFTIYPDDKKNEIMWSKCDRRTGCVQRGKLNLRCALYCDMADDMFEKFQTNVMPQYDMRYKSGERWNMVSWVATPVFVVNDNGGNWTVYARINSNISGTFNIIAYVSVGYDIALHPNTMGYYVQSFNAYKLEK
ncbi:MAG: VirB8/TrbF family protein [Alphaproteobacteria bacterium]